MQYLEELKEQMIRKLASMQDEVIREALGKWVSEIEPELLVRADGTIFAIGPIGCHTPIVPVRGVEVKTFYPHSLSF